jgi:hypothetical protein
MFNPMMMQSQQFTSKLKTFWKPPHIDYTDRHISGRSIDLYNYNINSNEPLF